MSIADRITSISNNLSNAYDGIEYLGVDTSSIDKNLQNLSSMLNVVYEGLPKVSDEGVSPSITGSRVGRLKSTLKASDTTQFSTTGKNKYNATINQVTEQNLIYYADTTKVFFNGTSTNRKLFKTMALPAGTYTLSMELKNGSLTSTYSNTAFYLYEGESWNYDGRTMNLSNSNNYKNSVTFTIDSETNLTLGIFFANDLTFNNAYVYYQIVSGSSPDYNFEPYTNGASPNPDYPQDIHVVKGNNTVEVCGKNLFNPNAVAQSRELNYGVIQYSSNSNLYYQKVKVGETYTFSRKSTDYSGYIGFSDEIPATGVKVNDVSNLSGLTSVTKTATYQYVVIQLRKTEDLSETMLELGSTATTYEPYNCTTYPINLPVQNLFDKDNADILIAYMNDATNIINTIEEPGADFKTLYISCSPNTTYTISKISSQRFAVAETQTTPAVGVTVSNKIFNNTGTNITITTSASANYLVVFYYLSTVDTLTEQQIRDSIQIELGNKANRYTPYGVAPIKLCKISTYQDKLFKAISGDTVYDTLTAEQKAGLVSGAWYKYAEVRKVVLNGSESWAYESRPTTPTNRTVISGWGVRGIRFAALNYYSNYFMFGSTTSNRMIFSGDRQIYISLDDTLTGVVSGDTNNEARDKVKAWLSTHNTTVYYVLATPTITQITDTTLISQLNALYNAMSKNGQTNVLQTNADNPFVIYASALKGE